VMPSETRAFGMTFPDDVASVESGISMAVAIGEYPTDLGDWFESRQSHLPG
jgi:hypothetical protein